MTSLKQRLQDELIGKDEELSIAEDQTTRVAMRIANTMKAAQRDAVATVLSHIAADVEGLIPERFKQPDDNLRVRAYKEGYNMALAEMSAALARYMKGD